MREFRFGDRGEEERGKLEDLARVFVDQRDEAVKHKESLELEREWAEDMAFYEGVETPGGGTALNPARSKPMMEAYPPGEDDDDTAAAGSEVFMNVTGPYTDSAAGRIIDLVIPGDDRAWEIEPTPVPDLEEVAKGRIPTYIERAIEEEIAAEAQAQAQAAQMAQGGNGGGMMDPGAVDAGAAAAPTPEQVEQIRESARLTIIEDAEQALQRTRAAAQRITKQIEDHLVECKWSTEVRTIVDDTMRIGTGVVKGPVHVRSRAMKVVDGRLQVSEGVRPASMRVDPRNCYPDPLARDSIHDGDFHWEVERDIGRHRLREIGRDPSYFQEVVAQCLEEGPLKRGQRATLEAGDNLPNSAKDRAFEIWTGYAWVGSQELEGLGGQMIDRAKEDRSRRQKAKDTPKDGTARDGSLYDGEYPDLLKSLDDVPVRVELINDRIVRIAPNSLESGAFPYDYLVIFPRYGMPWGRGIPRLARDAQRILTGSARALMNNAGLAGGPMFVMDKDAIEPENGTWEITALKVWVYNGATAEYQEVKHAFQTVDIPMHQAEFERIMAMAMQFFEDVTGQPVMLQGQQGSSTPDTVGGLRLLNDNASTPLRRQARMVDDRMTEPHISRYYEYSLLHGEENLGLEDADYRVSAQGSSALVQRDLESQTIIGLLDRAADPSFGLDPKKVMLAVLKSLHLNPKDYQFTDPAWEEVFERMKNPPPPFQVEVQKLRGEIDKFRAELASKDKAAEREKDLKIEMMRRESGDMVTMAKEREGIMRAQIDTAKLTTEERTRLHEINEETTRRLIEIDAHFKQEAMKLGFGADSAERDRQAHADEQQRELDQRRREADDKNDEGGGDE